jgi:hypothetical protein
MFIGIVGLGDFEFALMRILVGYFLDIRRISTNIQQISNLVST